MSLDRLSSLSTYRALTQLQQSLLRAVLLHNLDLPAACSLLGIQHGQRVWNSKKVQAVLEAYRQAERQEIADLEAITARTSKKGAEDALSCSPGAPGSTVEPSVDPAHTPKCPETAQAPKGRYRGWDTVQSCQRPRCERPASSDWNGTRLCSEHMAESVGEKPLDPDQYRRMALEATAQSWHHQQNAPEPWSDPDGRLNPRPDIFEVSSLFPNLTPANTAEWRQQIQAGQDERESLVREYLSQQARKHF